jgi:hypothetical protein
VLLIYNVLRAPVTPGVRRFGGESAGGIMTKARLGLLWFVVAILFFVVAMVRTETAAVYIALGVVFLTLGVTSHRKKGGK